ncbi:MAG: hypothetical protein RIQ54_357 [Candidatus Parcubacteria bacterium]|jgi:hypothetical protein
MHTIYHFFDKLEDKIRGFLSHYPIVYAFFGGVAIVLFWRGVWHFADEFSFMTGLVSLVIGSVLLLATGLFVSVFIGDQIIISGIRGEKKIAEQTEEEVQDEMSRLRAIERELKRLSDIIERHHR